MMAGKKKQIQKGTVEMELCTICAFKDDTVRTETPDGNLVIAACGSFYHRCPGFKPAKTNH